MALSASESKLPIIDFSKEAMKPGTKTWDLTSKHVLKALEEYGCFMATYNEINQELYTCFFSSLEKLFDLPKDTKRRFVSNVPFEGYVSDWPQNPLFEAMALSDPLSAQTIQNLTLLMWPQGDDTFCETLRSYAKQVSELEKTMRKMIFQSYSVERLFEIESQSMSYILRLMKYGAPMSDETSVGLGSHYDKSFMTILQADGSGFQVRTKEGEWISATPSRPSFIVIIGESFHGWSNGRLRCPLHRVRISGSKTRYSFGLFSTKNGTVEIPSELVDEQHTRLFRPFSQATLLQISKQIMIDDPNPNNSDDDKLVPIVTTHFAI